MIFSKKKRDRSIKAFLRRIYRNLPPPVHYALSKGSIYLGAGVIPILLFEYSPVLGWWWIVILLLYIALLIMLRWLILWPREKNALLNQIGPEQFYALFPKEKVRDERRKRRQEKRAAKLRRETDIYLL